MKLVIVPVVLGLSGATAGVAGVVSPGGSPIAVVRSFYAAANEGRCSEATQYFTDDSVVLINRVLAGEGGFARFCSDRAGRSPLDTIRIKSAEITEGDAKVVAERKYRDGSLSVETDRLVKTAGAWRIVVGERDARGR